MSFYLSICCIVKNEASYLEEWIEFHRLQGVEHFFIYDNLSIDNTAEVLQGYVEDGLVTLSLWPQHPGQLTAYNDALSRKELRSKWVAFIDADEFLFPTSGPDLPAVLHEFEAYSGIAVFWLIFGSSGHITRPHGLVTEAFVNRAPDAHGLNGVFKSIVQADKTLKTAGNPHQFHFTTGFVVNENDQPLTNVQFPVPNASFEKIRINHYFSKSREEWQEKVKRGRACTADPNLQRDDNTFHVHDRNEVCDLAIQRFVPQLREALGHRIRSRNS
jgi:glycosyltransferase involved in cell wall biosynthesis